MQKEHARLQTHRPKGRVLPGSASLPYRTIGLLKKKFAEIFGNSGIRVSGMIATRYGVLERRIVIIILCGSVRESRTGAPNRSKHVGIAKENPAPARLSP
jgi:hypothetical protein